MSLKTKIGSIGMFATLAFYAVVGIISFITLAIVDFRMVHIGIIGILSLITAYGLYKKRVWAIWVVVMLFFIATTFSLVMLYSSFGKNLLLDISIVAYVILTWIFTAYAATKRKTMEN